MGGEALRMHPHPTSSVEGEGKVRMTDGATYLPLSTLDGEAA
jgi:hypothetical protein